MNAYLEEIIQFVEATGFRILFCKNKIALLKEWQHKAFNDPKQIREGLQKWPNAQVAAVVPDNMVIFDFDPRHEETPGEHDRFKQQLPETRRTVSGRGDGGEHWWFYIPTGTELATAKMPKGVDLRRAGKNYVIIPPSVHNETGQPYTWAGGQLAHLPEQVIQALHPPERITPPALQAPAPTGSSGDGLVRTVTQAVEGERNDKLFWSACRALDAGNTEIIQDLFDAALSIGLTEGEATSTIQSAERAERVPVEPFTPNRHVSPEAKPQPKSENSEKTSSSTGLSGSSGYLWEVLDEVDQWLQRFILTTTPEDIHLITLWAAHTYVVEQTYTTGRLLIDSVMPESGKTTVLEHLEHLARAPLSASSISSEALLPRVLDRGIRTILIDEADRSLDPKDPIMKGVISTLNTGYKRGGSRPVLVKDSDGNWVDQEMSTYAPVAMAGNNPTLADDTRSRCIRILLMPDFEGRIEDSDWEDLEELADQLRIKLAEAMEAARDDIGTARPELPEGCTGRMREKWRPLARVAEVAGNHWPETINNLIDRDLKEREMERAEGIQNLPLRVHLIQDIAAVWPPTEQFVPTTEIVQKLAMEFPSRWGIQSTRGLKVQGLGRMLMQGYKISSERETSGQRRRGYYVPQFAEAWKRFQVPLPQTKPDQPDELDQPDQMMTLEKEQK